MNNQDDSGIKKQEIDTVSLVSEILPINGKRRNGDRFLGVEEPLIGPITKETYQKRKEIKEIFKSKSQNNEFIDNQKSADDRSQYLTGSTPEETQKRLQEYRERTKARKIMPNINDEAVNLELKINQENDNFDIQKNEKIIKSPKNRIVIFDSNQTIDSEKLISKKQPKKNQQQKLIKKEKRLIKKASQKQIKYDAIMAKVLDIQEQFAKMPSVNIQDLYLPPIVAPRASKIQQDKTRSPLKK